MIALVRLARSQRGFTLAELLIVIAILALMMAGLLAMQMQGQTSYLIGAHRVEAQQNARIALELMARELRPSTAVIAIPSATDMTFTTCVNPPACTTIQTIRYQLAGSTLNRTENGVSNPLIGGVQSLNLTYFSAYNGATNTGTTTTVAANVRLVRVQMITGTEESVASYSASNQQATLETLVQLRNM